MSKLTPFQESIVSLVFIRNVVEKTILCFYFKNGNDLLIRQDRLLDQNLVFSLKNYLQIQICSFVEEFDIFNRFSKNNESVRETMRIVSPAIERIKGWTGLYKIRSCVLAHNPREKNREVVFPWDIYRIENSPTTIYETFLLGFCALIIVDNIKSRHQDEQIKAEEVILKMDRIIQDKGINTSDDLERVFKEIQEKIQINKN